jgi:chromosome segregation ATPase
MSEDRILRLENAMATLAEISAQHNERLAAIERSNQRLEQTAQRLEQTAQRLEQNVQALGELTANVQRRVTRLEESYVTVVELLRSHHDGITEMRAAQANAEAKIAALAESQAHSDRKLDALIDIVRTRFNGQSESS